MPGGLTRMPFENLLPDSRRRAAAAAAAAHGEVVDVFHSLFLADMPPFPLLLDVWRNFFFPVH